MQNLYKLFGALFALVAIMAGTQALATGGFAALNTHPSDLDTVTVKNITKTGTSNVGWSQNVQADAGDVIGVQIYYHNSGNIPAVGVRTHIDQVMSGSNTSYQITGGVTAMNANPAFGGASVSLSSAQTLTYIPGSAVWRPNQMVSGSVAFPSGNGDSIYSAQGVSIGTIDQDTYENQFMHQGAVVANFRVGNYTPPAPQCPTVATGSGTATGQTGATLSGQLLSLGTAQSASLYFEYSTNSNLSGALRTDTQTRYQAGTVNATLANLSPNTLYYFRIVAESPNCNVPGSIQTVRTEAPTQPTIVPPQVTTISGTPLSQTTCLLNGSLDSLGNDTSATVSFDYSESFDLANAGHTGGQTMNGIGSFTALISSLTPDTVYFFRAVAVNSVGTARGSVLSCRTLAQGVTPPAGGDTNNNNNANASTTVIVTVGGQTQSQTVNQSNSQSVTVNTTNGGGYSYQPYYYPNYSYNYNPANAFTGVVTPAYVAPVVYSTPQIVPQRIATRSSIAPRTETISCTRGPSLNSATLTGYTEGDVLGQDLSAWFEWGPTPALGNRSPRQAVISRANVNPIDRTVLRVPNYGDPYYTGIRNMTYDSVVIPGRPNNSLGGANFNAQLNYLENGQVYFFRAVSENSVGTSYGNTLACRLEGGDLYLIPNYVAPIRTVTPAPVKAPINFTIPAYVPPTAPTTYASVEITKSAVNTTRPESQGRVTGVVGEGVRYSITVRNTGTKSLTSVRVTDKLSPYLRFTSASDNGTVSGPLETQIVSWNLGTLAVGSSRTLYVDTTVILCEVEHSIDNVAKLTSDQKSASSNNAPVTILPKASFGGSYGQSLSPITPSNLCGVSGCGVGGPLAFMIVPPQVSASVGESVVLSLRYQNQSNETLSNVALRSFLPTGTEFVSADNGAGQVVNFDRTTAFNVGTLTPGASGELRLTMRVASSAHVGDALALTGLASYNRANGERVDADTSATISVVGDTSGSTSGSAIKNLNKTGVGPGLLGSAFFPDTLFGWLGLILLIIVIIFVVRKSL